jgi:hypothetical protein
MTENLQSFYTHRKNDFTISLVQITSVIKQISTIRLLVAGLFLLVFYFAFSITELFYLLPILLIIFMILVRKHSTLFAEKTHLENLVKINTLELQALQGNLSGFNSGSEFIDPHHAYTHDLDIAGERSLFQYMNRTTTLSGKKLLAYSLANPLPDVDHIIARQQAAKELSLKTDFRQHFQATGMELEELKSDNYQLLEWVKEKPFLYGNNFISILLWVLPVLTILSIILSFFLDNFLTIASVLAGAQWATLSSRLKRVNAFHQYISRKKNILNKYARLLHLFGKEQFEAPLLQQLKTKAAQADKRIKSLAELVSALDARLNFMTNLVVNSTLLYDLQCIYRLEKWKEDNASQLQIWLDVINETDVLCSLGTFSYNHAEFCFPLITSDQKIVATSLGHPLLAHEGCVTNNVSIGERQNILVITGANMAGKSTFLRTLGINLVLALSGAPVYATSFVCPIINIRSGMRTADSLQDHQSYFYAELNRLKRIMDELREGKPLFILLDEILKGTNSTDKQAGSIALVKQLVSYSCIGLIATHDLALGDLEKEYPDHVKNYCFEPTIENDQLSFDYTLKEGLAQKMNATFLMKKMGIIPPS